MRPLSAALLVLLPVLAPLPVLVAAAQDPDPCESLLGQSQDRPAWPGIVLEALSGDTLLIQLKGIGPRRVRLAGLRAPGQGNLAAVSRFHLARLAKGIRIFVVLEPPWKAWPAEVTALVEDFTEAQLRAGMGTYQPEEAGLLGGYLACRCQGAERQARATGIGVWGP